MNKQRVTLYIDGNVWRTFRIRCLENKTSASAVVERWMEKLTPELTPEPEVTPGVKTDTPVPDAE